MFNNTSGWKRDSSDGSDSRIGTGGYCHDRACKYASKFVTALFALRVSRFQKLILLSRKIITVTLCRPVCSPYDELDS